MRVVVGLVVMDGLVTVVLVKVLLFFRVRFVLMRVVVGLMVVDGLVTIVLVEVLLFFRVRFVLMRVVVGLVVMDGLVTIVLVEVLLFFWVRFILMRMVVGLVVVDGLMSVVLIEVLLICSVVVNRSGVVLCGLMMDSSNLVVNGNSVVLSWVVMSSGDILVMHERGMVGIRMDDVVVNLFVRSLVVRCFRVLVGLVVQIVVLVIAIVVAEDVVAYVSLLIVEVTMVRRENSNVTVVCSENTIRMGDIVVIIIVVIVDVGICNTVVVMLGVAPPVVVALSPFMAVGSDIGRVTVRSNVGMMRHSVGYFTVGPLVCGVLRGDVEGSLMVGWRVITLVVALEVMSDWSIRGDSLMIRSLVPRGAMIDRLMPLDGLVVNRHLVGGYMVLLVNRLLIVALSIGVSQDVSIHGSWHRGCPVLTISVAINSIGVVNTISIGVVTIVISVVGLVMKAVVISVVLTGTVVVLIFLISSDSDSGNGSESE